MLIHSTVGIILSQWEMNNHYFYRLLTHDMHKPHNPFKAYLDTLYYYSKDKLPIAFFWLVIASLTEGIGLMLLLPLLTSLGVGGEDGTDHSILLAIKEIFTRIGIPSDLWIFLAVFLLLIILRAIIGYSRDTYLHKLQLEFVDKFGVSLHKAFGKASWSFLMQQRGSDFSHILTKDVFRIGMGTQIFLQAVVSFSLVMTYLLVSLYLSPYLTLIVIVAGGSLLWGLKGYIRKALHLGKEQTSTGQAVFASINEFLGGIKLVKSYGAEAHYLDYFKRATAEQRLKQIAFKRNSSVAQQSFQVGSAILLCIFVYAAIELLTVPITQLLILTLIFIRLMPLLSGLQRNYENLMHMLPAFSSTLEFRRRCEESAETTVLQTNESPWSLNRDILFKTVCFRYVEHTILDDINIRFPASKTTAIMGESGSGKSTLADLLAGLILPNSGRISIDTVDLQEENVLSWRKQVAYVPQDVFLFHDTIRANMLWVNPNADDQQLWDVLTLAAARSFVKKLPQGLDTVIGERGIRLSGGERQRIALARALLRKPLLLILDEATSALDHQNEQMIRDSLNRLHGSMTIVLIAHRLTTVESADQILLLKDKKLMKTTLKQQIS